MVVGCRMLPITGYSKFTLRKNVWASLATRALRKRAALPWFLLVFRMPAPVALPRLPMSPFLKKYVSIG